MTLKIKRCIYSFSFQSQASPSYKSSFSPSQAGSLFQAQGTKYAGKGLANVKEEHTNVHNLKEFSWVENRKKTDQPLVWAVSQGTKETCTRCF